MIELRIPWLPPSANNAYFNLPRGGRTLTNKGKKFKRETAAHLVQTYPTQLKFFEPNRPYGLAIQFVFENMLNKTYPEKAATRYKKVDTSNRLKLLEDVLAEVANTDDSQHLFLLIDKYDGAPEATKIWAWDLEREGTLPDDVISLFRCL